MLIKHHEFVQLFGPAPLTEPKTGRDLLLAGVDVNAVGGP
jgi:hypothetical protein